MVVPGETGRFSRPNLNRKPGWALGQLNRLAPTCSLTDDALSCLLLLDPSETADHSQHTGAAAFWPVPPSGAPAVWAAAWPPKRCGWEWLWRMTLIVWYDGRAHTCHLLCKPGSGGQSVWSYLARNTQGLFICLVLSGCLDFVSCFFWDNDFCLMYWIMKCGFLPRKTFGLYCLPVLWVPVLL